MTINTDKNGSALTVALEGRLDTLTAPELDDFLKDALKDVTDLTFDFEKLEYISSSGLRTLLKTQKQMNTVGTMKVCRINALVREVLELTGFDSILTIVED